MAKSTYLDKLIKGTLPIIHRSSYINYIWRETDDSKVSPPTSSIFTNFTNSLDYTFFVDNDLNNLEHTMRNNLVTNLKYKYASNITLEDKYLPRTLKNKENNTPGKDEYKYGLDISAPPNYLPAMITRTTNGIVKEIPVLFPKSFSRSIQANFAKENPVGSTVPIVAYSYTGAESIPLEFDVLADYLPAAYKNLGLNAYIEDIISLLKPNKAGSIIYEPTVAVSFADISFQGICESVSVSYDNLYNYKSFTHAVIDCQFTKLS